MTETNAFLDRVVQDVETICQPLHIPVMHRHEEEPSHIRVEVSCEPDDIVRVILYPGPLTDDTSRFGKQLDDALIKLFTEHYKIVETVRGESFGNTWRVVAKPA